MDSFSQPATHPSFPCPHCRTPIESHWKFCIGCGLRPEPRALEIIAHLDYALHDMTRWVGAGLTDAATAHRIAAHYQAQRENIIAALRPAPGAPESAPEPAAAVPPRPAAPKPPPQPPKPLLERLSDPATLKLMVYGGSLMIVVGALIYLRELIATQLQKPLIQAGLLAAVTLATFSLGVRLLRRTQEELAGRGLLLIGALLIPLNPWFAVHAGLIPRGNRAWMVGAVCTAIYGAAAVALGETLLLHLAVPAALLTTFGFLGAVLHAPPDLYAWTLAAFSLALLGLSSSAGRAAGGFAVCATPFRHWSCVGFALVTLLYAGLCRWLPPVSLAAFGTNAIAPVGALTTLGVTLAGAVGFGVLALQRRNEPLAHLALGLPAAVGVELLLTDAPAPQTHAVAAFLAAYGAAVGAVAVVAKRKSAERATEDLISRVGGSSGFVILAAAAAIALASFDPALCAGVGFTCFLFGNFIWRRTLGIAQIALGIALATMSHLLFLDRFDLFNVVEPQFHWSLPAAVVWLLVVQAAGEIADRLERAATVRATPLFAADGRWSQTLFPATLVLAAPFALTFSFFTFFACATPIIVGSGEIAFPAIRPVSPLILGATLVALSATWGLRQKATRWHVVTLGASVYAGFLFIVSLANFGAAALALALIGFSIVFRIVAELIGANLASEYSTNVGTSFGLDFGLPRHPRVAPALVTANVVVALTAAAAALGGMTSPPRASLVEPVIFILAALYCGFCGFFTDAPRRSFAHYLFFCASVLTALAFGLADWFGVFGFAHLPYAAGAAALTYFLADAVESVSEGALARAMRTSAAVTLGGACVLALGVIDGARKEQIGNVIVFLAAALCAGRAATAGATRTIYAAALAGLLAYAQALRLAHAPMEAYPAAILLYGFLAIALGVQYLPKLTTRAVKRPAELAGALEIAGYAIGEFALIFVFLTGVAAAPFDGATRTVVLSTLALAATATAVVSVMSPRAGVREGASLASLALGSLLYVRLLLAFAGFAPGERPEAFTAPVGAALILVGWLKLSGRNASGVFARLYVWAGSLLLCGPVLLHALQARFLDGRASWPLDILVDTIALAAVGGGAWGRLRGPFCVGLTTIALHLLIVVIDSVKWGAIPYAVYLVGVGLLIGVSGWLLSRKRRELEALQSAMRANWRARAGAFSEWR
jgi:hypothetical protein